MARQFNGTDQSLQSEASLDLTGVTKLSLAWSMYWDAFANDDDLAFESSSNFNLAAGAIFCDPNSSAGVFALGPHASGSNYNTVSIPRPSAAAWHKYVVTMDLAAWSTSIPCAVTGVWVDGSSQTLSAVNLTGTAPSDFGNHVWFFMCRNAASLFGAGRMAEFGIWTGVTLDAAEAVALGNGAAPPLIRPTSLAFYWPMIGRTSPEQAGKGPTNLTVTSATTVEHSRVIYPSSPVPSAVADAAAGNGTATIAWLTA